MKFKLDVTRSAAMAVLAMTLLASCGGGTQIESFVPKRVIAFGDEASIVNTDGTKYTVNGVVFQDVVPPATVSAGPKVPTELSCTSNLVWTQQLAYSYGLAFIGRCPSTIASPNGVMLATVGARAADLKLQIDGFMAGDTFASNDLVTVLVGVNDIIALYQSQADPTTNSAALVAAAQQAGTEVGAQVVRITDRGAKVLVSTIPSMGYSPFAAAEELANPGRAAFLAMLSEQFNTKLRLKLEEVRDGGRAVGLILADELVQTMTKFPTTYGLNATYFNTAACATTTTAQLPTCNMANVIEADPLVPTYGSDRLWADGTHLGAGAQVRIGSLAFSRARGNPF